MSTVSFSVLQEILRGVDARLTWKPNALIYKGGADFWPGPNDIDYDAPFLEGDCKVHTLLCRYEAKKQNIDSHIMICLNELGQVHMVLEVDEWILDNRNPIVQNKNDLKYTWIERSGVYQGDPWHLIQKD